MKWIKRKKTVQSARKASFFWWLIPTALCASTAMITLSSCAKEASKPSFLSSQIDVGDGTKFGDDDAFTIREIATKALQNKDGYNSLLRWKIGSALQEWFHHSKSPTYRDEYNKIVKQVDKDWKDKVTSAKNSYRNWWEANLREDLDNAGAKDVKAWKMAQINKKLVDKFVSDVFGVDYLGIKSDHGDAKLDKRTIPYKDLNDPSKWVNFQFLADKADLDTTNGLNKDVADAYASFQAKVFDQWVRKTLPILTCSVLYKNSQPRSGLTAIFNQDTYNSASGISLSPSYQFQAFPDAKEGERKLTSNANELFAKFCDQLTNNLSAYYNEKSGAVNFQAKWTEDSASGILVNTSSMYKDLFLPYAAGTAYLLMNAVGGFNSTDQKIFSQAWNQIIASPPTNNGPGNILSKFIVKTAGPVNGSSEWRSWWGFENHDYFSNNKIFSEKISDDYKFYADLAASNHAIVDMFTCGDSSAKISGSSPSLPLMFLRDGSQAGSGIHILTIDGLKYFVKDGMLDLEKLKQFLLFRSLQKVCGDGGYKTPEVGGNNVDFNVSKKIKDYFNSSDDVKLNLIADFLRKQRDEQETSSFFKAAGDKSALADSLAVFSNENFNKLREAWEHYEAADQLVNERKEIRSKIVSNAKTFIDNIKDDKALANGIAGRLPFQIEMESGQVKALEKFYELYNEKDHADKTSTWWTLTSGQGKALADASQTLETETPKIVEFELAKAYVATLNLQKASKLDYPDYTQCVYTNDDAMNDVINTVLTAAGSDNIISNDYKHGVIEGAIEKKLKVLKYVKDPKGCGKDKLAFIKDTNGQDSDKLMNAVINSYYLKNVFLNKLSDRSIISSGLPKDFSGLSQNLQDKFAEQNKSDTQFATNFLLFVNTLDYLLSPVRDQETKENAEINLTNYLKQDISFGTVAYVAWFVGAPMEHHSSKQKANGYNTEDIKERFTKNDSINIDYAFGTSENYLNLTTPVKDPDLYLVDSFYRSAAINDQQKNELNNYRGFCGLITDSSSSALPSTLSSTIFNSLNFKSVGQLYAYASGEGEGKTKKLEDYIKNFQTISQLQTFATKLQKAGIAVENVLNPDPDHKTLDDLKKALMDDCKAGEKYFNKATGTVAQDAFIADHSSTEEKTYSPVEDDSKDKLGYFAYLTQINYYDVVGTDTSSGKQGGVTSSFLTDPTHRLGLSLEAFLGIAADYAMNNSSAQQAAVDRVIARDDKKARVQVYDQRLMKLITSQWVRTKPKEEKVV